MALASVPPTSRRPTSGLFASLLLPVLMAAVPAPADPHPAVSSVAPSVAPSIAPFDTAYRRLMAPAGFRPADFNLLVNYRAEIPRTLPAVEALLRRPTTVDSLVPALRAALGSSSSMPLWSWLEVPPPKISPLLKAGPAMVGLWTRIHSAEALLHDGLQSLSPGETAFLRQELPGLLGHSPEDTSLDPVASETERLQTDALIDSVIKVADKIQLDKIARASAELEEVRRSLLSSVQENGIPKTLALLDTLRAHGVPVEIGGTGDDVHRLDHGIVFDPAGNDRYEFPDSVRPGSWLLVIDLEGNDTYTARDSVGGAAGFLSAQILDDQGGNDTYRGLDLAFGAAVLGYSHLIDRAGNDTYEARCASLGFAFYGIGILEDQGGNDTYSAAYFSEGAASTRGIGVLRDDAGDDQYLTRPVFTDDLRYNDHFLSMSQGFSSGFAPRYAGGIGALWDRAGNDVYEADIFGQGTGYWFSWGLLMDDAGNDSLTAYQYAQGAGVHFAAGTLWDKAGNDVRTSKGVSQGCGHDGGFGLLVDEQGNDHNAATDMSAGAGSANGLGVFLDLRGDDGYAMKNPRMTLGHGDLRRDRGSMGFFLDLGGRDAYPFDSSSGSFTDPTRSQNHAAWHVYDATKRGYGYGLDAE